MDNGLRALFRRVSRQHRPVQLARPAPNYRTLRYAFMDEDFDRAAHTREVKRGERKTFEQFINTGIPGDLGLYLTKHGTIQVIGEPVQNNRVLMSFNKQSITANATRANHIKPMLVELARREKLKLNLTNDNIEVRDGIAIAFWAFKEPKEVDDTQLVNKAQPNVTPPSVRRAEEEELQRRERAMEQMTRQYAARYTASTSSDIVFW
jgi:hypothetical protein